MVGCDTGWSRQQCICLSASLFVPCWASQEWTVICVCYGLYVGRADMLAEMWPADKAPQH